MAGGATVPRPRSGLSPRSLHWRATAKPHGQSCSMDPGRPAWRRRASALPWFILGIDGAMARTTASWSWSMHFRTAKRFWSTPPMRGFVPGCTHWARRLQVPGRFWTNSPRRATQWSRAPAAAQRWRPSAAWSDSAAWTGRSSRRRGCGKSDPAARIPVQSVCGRGSVLNCQAVPKEVTDGQIIEKICIRFDARL